MSNSNELVNHVCLANSIERALTCNLRMIRFLFDDKHLLEIFVRNDSVCVLDKLQSAGRARISQRKSLLLWQIKYVHNRIEMWNLQVKECLQVSVGNRVISYWKSHSVVGCFRLVFCYSASHR